MKKLLLVLIVFGQMLFAQQVSVQSITFLKDSESGGFYYPTFSPTGEFLLVTSENYTGLKQFSFSDKTLKTLTTDAGAGFGVQISADGATVLYKKTEFVKNLKNTSLISYVRSTGKQTQLVGATRENITAKFTANKPQFVKGKTLVRSNIKVTEVVPVICIEDQKMVLYTGSKRNVIAPNWQQASYIWPTISPDKKNIAYTVAGKGTFVCQINGSNPKSLGKLNAPTWINNQWLVGMDDKDDGQDLLSSTLVAVSIDGKVRQIIATPSGKMAMYPAASADGKRIAFNTEKGELYLLNIEIK